MWTKYLEREDSKIVGELHEEQYHLSTTVPRQMRLTCEMFCLSDLFVGQLKSSLTCSHCGFCSTVFDPFWDLSLPIAKVWTLNTPHNVCKDVLFIDLYTHTIATRYFSSSRLYSLTSTLQKYTMQEIWKRILDCKLSSESVCILVCVHVCLCLCANVNASMFTLRRAMVRWASWTACGSSPKKMSWMGMRSQYVSMHNSIFHVEDRGFYACTELHCCFFSTDVLQVQSETKMHQEVHSTEVPQDLSSAYLFCY